MIRELNINDVQDFRELIINMYSDLENLEWFSPMPYDTENVKGMIENPRFYIIGYFIDNSLVAVGSLDYKCGKLIGKIDLPEFSEPSKVVEIAFHMVHSKYKGQGIMKKLVNYLLSKIKEDNFELAFGKVHINNLASSTSLIKTGFEIYSGYSKPVKMSEFVELSNAPFFSKRGKENAKITLSKYNTSEENIIVDYNILVKKM